MAVNQSVFFSCLAATTLPFIRSTAEGLFMAFDFTEITFRKSPRCDVLYTTFIFADLPGRRGFLDQYGTVHPQLVDTELSTSGAVPLFV